MSRKRPRRPADRAAKLAPKVTAPAPPKRRRWLKGILIAVALCIPALLAYSNSFHAGFTLDNDAIILHNPAIQSATSANLTLILQHTYWWPKFEVGLYRPVTTVSYLLNYAVLGNRENPLGYHVVNFLLHCINVLLVYLLARRSVQGAWLPELIAMAWAVHPVLTESVTNIVGRADLLAGAAILGGFLLYMKGMETTGWTRTGYFAGLFASTTLGVFSKESAVALLGVVILYEALIRNDGRNLKAALWGCAAIGIPILFLLYERYQLLASNPPQPPSFLDNPLFGAHFFQGKLTAIALMARYVWKLAWPATLSADYSYNQIPLATGAVRDWMAWGLIVAILAVAAILYKRNKTAFFFVAFAFIVFIPTSNLFFNFGTIMAERFLYLPAIGIAACLALLLRVLSERLAWGTLAPVAMVLIIGAWGIRTYVRNKDWQDDLTLARASVTAAPESYKSHAALASALSRTEPIRQNIDAAIAQSEMALIILKDVSDEKNEVNPYFNAATYYQQKGDLSLGAPQSRTGQTDPPEATRSYQKALELLLDAIRIDKQAGERQRNLAIQRGTPESQIGHPASPGLYVQIARVYLKLREPDQAYRAASYARALSPQKEESSLVTAEAAASAGRNDESAVALVTGLLITGDKRFLGPLNVLYRGGLDPKGCAFSATANGPFLNNSCEPVHANICGAFADMIEMNRWNLHEDIAARAKSRAIVEFGCSEQSLAQGRKIQEFPLP
jgi:protein O-mannosyl-transferase